MTSIWITRPYDRNGIEEVKLLQAGSNFVSYETPGLRHWDSGVSEGVYWHRDRADAIMAARRFRAKWIVETKKEADRVAALPFPFEAPAPSSIME